MLEKVIDILSEYTQKDSKEISVQSQLIADLELSSLDVINVVIAFEDEFGIEIPDEQIYEFVTVGDIVEYLENCRQ